MGEHSRPVEKAAVPALRLYGGLALSGTIALGLLAGLPPLGSAGIVLAALSLLSELWPVSIFRKGLRITFTLPFLVGIVVLAGPFNALLVDVAVTLLSAISISLLEKRPVGRIWPALNVSIAAISASASGALWLMLHGSGRPVGWALLAVVGAYVVCYVSFNFILVGLLDRTVHRRALADSFMQSWRPSVQAICVYVLVSVMVAFLARVGYAAWSVMAIVPILALRHTLAAQAKYFEQYYETITALSMMLQRVHPYTHGHLHRVAAIAEEVASKLGLPAKRAQWVREAAILHDIGKIAIDEEVLDKPGRLTQEEFAHVKQHASFGAQILEPVEAFHPIVRWIRHHHERPDGSGYPDQLSDPEIPIESKIIAVVDAFDAMTGGAEGSEKRSYREPMSTADALEELDRCSGSQFDAHVVAAFKEVLVEGVA